MLLLRKIESILFIAGALFATINASQPPTVAGTVFRGGARFSNLCGKTVQDANLTGVWTYNPNITQLQQTGQPDNNSGSTLPVQFLATVAQSSGVQNATDQWSLWYSSLGADYADDFNLPYDVCAYTVQTISTNTVYRAQNDDGNCETAMSSQCVQDIQTQAQELALNATLNPVTQKTLSSLTYNSLYQICPKIGRQIQQNFPSSCMEFMNQTVAPSVSGFPLTGYNSSILTRTCKIMNPLNDTSYTLLATINEFNYNNGHTATTLYKQMDYFMAPILLTFMPIANAQAPITIQQSVAKLECVRVNRVQGNSLIPSTEPKPTPLSGTTTVSKGDIAGIVVGGVTFLALIGAGIFLTVRYLRKRKQKRDNDFISLDAKLQEVAPAYTSGIQESNARWNGSQVYYKDDGGVEVIPLTQLQHYAHMRKTSSGQRVVELEESEYPSLGREAWQSVAELPVYR